MNNTPNLNKDIFDNKGNRIFYSKNANMFVKYEHELKVGVYLKTKKHVFKIISVDSYNGVLTTQQSGNMKERKYRICDMINSLNSGSFKTIKHSNEKAIN